MDADDRFDVVLLGFSVGSAEPPAAGLKRVFGIDDAAAGKILAELPRTVQKHVPRVRAEYFRRALASIGAEVELRDRDGQVVGLGEHDDRSIPLGRNGTAAAHDPPPTHAATIVLARSETVPSHDFGAPSARPDRTIVQGARSADPEPEAPYPSHARTIVDREAPVVADAAPVLDAAPLTEATPVVGQASSVTDAAPVVEAATPVTDAAPVVEAAVPVTDAAPVVEAATPVTDAAPVRAPAPAPPATLSATAVMSTPRPAAKAALRPAPEATARTAPVPGPRAAGAPQAKAPAAPRIDARSFWESFGDALVVPFRGSGMFWLAAITIWSIIVGLLAALAGFVPFPVFAMIVSVLAQTSLVAFACDFYKVCMWVPTTGGASIDRPPKLDPERIFDTYVKSGLHLSMFWLLSMVPLLAWLASERSLATLADVEELVAIALDPLTWFFVLLPGIYWPVGVGLTALANDFAAIWNLPLAFRAFGRAPLELLAIVGVGWGVFCGSWLLLALFGASMGLPGFLLQTSGGLPLALSHGMMGALFGHLVRARADLLD